MNDITKLPIWAQNTIAGLKSHIAAYERDMAMIVGATPTPIEIDTLRKYRGAEVPRMFLPENYPIGFTVEGGRVDVRLRDGEVEICGIGDGERTMIVLPHVSNVIKVRFEKKD